LDGYANRIDEPGKFASKKILYYRYYTVIHYR
jgi:hypothetical protein